MMMVLMVLMMMGRECWFRGWMAEYWKMVDQTITSG